MPEYIPPVQLPTGLAESLINLTAQSGNPWGNLLQSLGRDVNQAGQSYAQKLQLQRENQFKQQALNIEKLKAENMMGKGMIALTMDKLTPALREKGWSEGQLIPVATYNFLAKPPSPIDQALSSMNQVVDAVHERKIAPSQAASGFGPFKTLFASAYAKKYPNDDMRELESEFSGQKTSAVKTASEAAGIKVPLQSAHTAFMNVMEDAANVAKDMDQSDIRIFNQAVQAGKLQFNNPNAVKLYTFMDEAAGNYARIKKGGAASVSTEEQQEALKVLSNKLNEGGIRAVMDAVETEYQGRIEGLPKGKGSKTKQKSNEGVTIPSLEDIQAELKRRGEQ